VLVRLQSSVPCCI